MYKKKILEKLKNTRLTKKEKRIAEFFLDEEQRVFLMNVADIAKTIDVSDTSVIRFIKSLGFENFTDFKNSGQEDIKSRLDKTNDFIKNLDIIKENSIEQLYIHKINEEVNKIFNSSSQKQIKKISNLIMKAKNKYIVGFKSTAGIANFFGVRLGFMLENVSTFNIDDSVVVNSIFNIKQEDILIIFDYPMYSKAAVVLAKIVRENKAKILLFTDSDNAPLAEYSDILYKVKLNGISVFNSLISTQILIEYLLTYISQFIEEKAKIRFSKIRKYLIEKL
ncbi:MurR/RpiR family transcriptional regulator [Fusobacterium animalis]|uniref:Transcriptional regulator, RpiR family n=1 Tax=Fusobacterium nucleatum TaxID=851 RepID=A0A133NT30_FUSNU|nr:MurR/RpiR family transcriptional regulator [Fusobacterium nucleatum]KXA19445.1 transcriptional regulator, RpiR family [Fusobacterium nucleatum]MCL4576895.1 transcriptional regulator [Fusobacterium nucleatum YWH7056]MCL4583075.1 transcriptional regulator [Fusobacterium nucleatum YWH7054]MCL4592900.1 transcriptional regulator [Fusobacterium nucleatum YWH7053]